ncbi:MAG: MATE family efflux transporter [Pseudomonadota bacterium]
MTLIRVFSIAVPMTIAYASTPLLGLVDTGVAGRLDDVVILGGLAIGAILFDLVFTAFNFLRSSVVGLTAQAFGARADEELDAVFLRALAVACIGGVATIALAPALLWLGLWFFNAEGPLAEAISTYFMVRVLASPMALSVYVITGHFLGLGHSRTVLGIQLLLNGTNMVFSVLLGLTLGYGIAGIAAATLIGETLATLTGLWIWWRSRRNRPLPSRARLLDRAAIGKFFALNRDITIRSFCLLFAFVIFTRVGTGFGEVTLAANAVLMQVFLLSGYLLDGLATAAEQMVGQSLGARDRRGFKRTVRLCMVCAGLFAVALFALYMLVHGPFIDLLVVDEAVRHEARIYILWAALTPIFGFVAFQMDGVYIGASWGREMRNWMLVSFALYLAAVGGAVWLQSNHALWLALNIFLGARGITLCAALPRKIASAF